jgi:AcrR family transcriptional regulator
MSFTVNSLLRPRKPERANGRVRYEQLIDAAESILVTDGADGLTIQNIATVAGVPMASVYHFFPSPAAASVALADRYLAGFADTVAQFIAELQEEDWEIAIAALMHRTTAYYRAHPHVARLLFGSDHSWQIRLADVANNQAMASALAAALANQFSLQPPSKVAEIFKNAIQISDSLWALSIALHDEINDKYAFEAERAVISYIRDRLRN